MKMRKILYCQLAMILLVASLTVGNLSIHANAADIEAEETEDILILYSVEAETSLSELERRIEANKDDLQDRRGLKMDYAISALDEYISDVGYTTQLISVYMVDGSLCEEYVISVMAEYKERDCNKTTEAGYKVATSIFYTWYDNERSLCKFHESTAYYIVTGSPTSTPYQMVMENEIYTGYDENLRFRNSNGFTPQAGVTYTLASATNKILTFDYFGYIKSLVTLALNDGTNIQVFLQGACDIQWPCD